MSVEAYVKDIGVHTRNLTEASDFIGRLVDDVCEAQRQATAEGADTEVQIWNEVSVFLGSAGIATEEALNRLTLYAEWIEAGAPEDQPPDEEEVW